MKSAIFLFIINFTFSIPVNAQVGFNIIHDPGLPTNHIRDMIVDNDHIVGMGMAYADSSFSQQGLLLVKYDSSGNFIASNLILDSLGDYLSVDKHWGKIVNTPDGGYAMTTATFNRNSALLIKTDNDFGIEFIKEYEDTVNLSNFRYEIESITSGFILYGSIQRPNFKINPFVRRVDSQGNTIWFNYYGDYNKTASVVNLKIINDSVMVAAIVEDVGTNSARSKLVFIDMGEGNILDVWNSEPQPEIGYLRKVIPIAGGGGFITYGVYVTEITPNGTRMVQSTLARLSADFELLWVEHFGEIAPLGGIGFWDIEQTLDGYYVGAGESNIFIPNESALSTGWLLKFTEYGDMLWERKDMGPYPENYINGHYFGGVGVLSSGNIVAGGTARKVNTNYIWLVKVTTDGCMDTILCEPITGIVERAKKEGVEMKVYPNPASQEISIELQNSNTDYFITIYNARGEKVASLPANSSSAKTVISVAHFSPGIYFLELRNKEGIVGREKVVVHR